MTNLNSITPEIAAKLLESVKYILLDVDGVLWSGQHVFPHIPETLQYLRSIGKQVRFLTNNASVSRAELVHRFHQRGIDGVSANEVYNSAYAAALRMQTLLAPHSGAKVERHVFVVGEKGLHAELRQVMAPGYTTYGAELHDMESCGGYDPHHVAAAWKQHTLPSPFSTKSDNEEDNEQPHVTPCFTKGEGGCISLGELNPAAVVVGLDLHFNMLKLAYAALCLQPRPTNTNHTAAAKANQTPHTLGENGKAPGVYFIATNEDPQIPFGSDSALLPGAGAMVSAVSTVSGRRPDVVCGKPHVDMAEILFAAEGITDRRQCVMIGDRLSTDIAFGNAAGCRTVFVLSGAESLAHVAEAEAAGQEVFLPEFVAASLAVFLPEADKQ